MERDVKRKKIMEDSIEGMYLKGYHATSVNDLAEAAGIPKSTFYSFFKSKEDYALCALDFYSNTLNDVNLQYLIDKTVKPLDRIKNFYEAKIKNMEIKEYKYGCFIGNLTQEMSDVNKNVAEVTEQLHKNVSAKILDCIVDAIENDSYELPLEPDILADYINNSWQGALVRMKSSENSVPLDEFYKVLVNVLIK